MFTIKNNLDNIEIDLEDFMYAMKSLSSTNTNNYHFLDLYDNAQKFMNNIHKLENKTDLLISINKDLNSSKTDEINKILTMVATAFVPPTFICSVYGIKRRRTSGRRARI